MTAVRPPIWPAAQPATPPAAGGARAAFFQAALNKAAAPAAEPAPAVRTVRAEPAASAQAQPQKILRPGSLLDIKV